MCFCVCVQCLCIWPLVMSLHRLAWISTHVILLACSLYVWACCDRSARILCACALRLCGENWQWETWWCGGIDLLHCHLQCWVAVFPMHQPEQWVEPMLVWLVWLGGKWKPLSRFFSLSHPNAKHRREVIWIAKAELGMHVLALGNLDRRLSFYVLTLFCFFHVSQNEHHLIKPFCSFSFISNWNMNIYMNNMNNKMPHN